MIKSYCSLGLMSGTSGDGIDASIIQSDGDSEYKVLLDKYFRYNKNIQKRIHKLKDKINNSKKLKKFSKKITNLEKEITEFHAKAVNKIIQENKLKIDLIGFHGQTIFHNAKEKISKQIGDGKNLSKIIKKKVVCDFRKNDLKNGGEGAPLAPIFHKLIVNQKKIKLPVLILNLGGIANWTIVKKINNEKDLYSSDAGPGNCLIDQWIKKKSNFNYDKNGFIAKSGKANKAIINKAMDNYKKKIICKNKKKDINYFTKRISYDVKDFDSSFVNGLSLKDGAATLTEYTSLIIAEVINALPDVRCVIVCGGGRKNKFLYESISKKIKYKIKLIDSFGINGDFVESQAFAYLAIRSYLNLPISFYGTTGVVKPCVGGVLFKN